MPILKRCLAIAGFLCLAMPAAPAEEAQEARHMLSGQVTRVFDGDTLEVQVGPGKLRVHINGVDAPELSQPWGKQAQGALAQLVLGQSVDLEPVGAARRKRITAIVFVGEAEVGAALISDGNAWADRQDLRPSDIGLCEVEASAREARRGLWSLPPAQRVAPWEFRMRFVHPLHRDYSTETAGNCKSVAMRKRSRLPAPAVPVAAD
jgi:endonuclease YncB( thermonuclease family)